MDDRIKLKMSLEDIRKAIDVCKYWDAWKNMDSTNCYAYALGLDIEENSICYNAYQPGVISGRILNYSDLNNLDVEDILNGIYSDLNALGISYREVFPNARLSSGEWVIALLASRTGSKIDGFHFLRKNGGFLWYHKDGYDGIIKNTDNKGNHIFSPDKCYFKGMEYISSYSLKLR